MARKHAIFIIIYGMALVPLFAAVFKQKTIDSYRAGRFSIAKMRNQISVSSGNKNSMAKRESWTESG